MTENFKDLEKFNVSVDYHSERLSEVKNSILNCLNLNTNEKATLENPKV